MTVNNTATRDVYRPTMRRELLTPNNKGVEVVMVETNSDPNAPGPGPEYADLAMTDPVVTGLAVVGETLTCSQPTVTGGSGEHKFVYTWRLVGNAGTTFASGSEVVVPSGIVGEQGYCEVVVNDVTADASISKDSNVVGPVESPSTLVYSNPVVTGEPWVGETLHCSEPVVSGGIGPMQYDYFWVDETNAIIWDDNYMGNTTTVVADDIGKMMKCLVQITDKGWSGGESITVESNSVGPVRAPLIGDLTTKVDGQPYDWEEGMFIETMNGAEHLVLIERDGEPGVSYTWFVKQGQARLTPSSGSCIVIIQSVPPQGVQIQCDLINKNASDNPKTVRFPFFVGEG